MWQPEAAVQALGPPPEQAQPQPVQAQPLPEWAGKLVNLQNFAKPEIFSGRPSDWPEWKFRFRPTWSLWSRAIVWICIRTFGRSF